MLSPGALVAYAMPSASSSSSGGIPGLPGAVGQKEYDLKDLPGDPARGLEVFRSFCSGCHNFKAAGIQGGNKPGSDLDARRPTFTQIVRLIVQGGGGGLPSKLLLRQLTFQQIYDVSAFVALYADSTRPVRGATRALPVPVELGTPLRPPGQGPTAAPGGNFRATLSGRALSWRLVVHGAKPLTLTGRIQFTGAAKAVKPVLLDCNPCTVPGNGFVVVTRAQAAAMKSGRTVVVVRSPDTYGPLLGQIRKIA